MTSEADPFVDLFIRYDAKYDMYQRKIYSILELLADIGGLYHSLFVIGFVLVNFIAYRLFVASILKQIYQVKHDRNGGVEKRQWGDHLEKAGGAKVVSIKVQDETLS